MSNRCSARALALVLLYAAPVLPALFAGAAFTAPAECQTLSARFANPPPMRRREWGLATVPFAQGVWRPGMQFRPEGLEGELTPFGARWPDGSVRYAQLATKLDLAPGEERVVRVVQGTPHVSPFRLSPWAASALSSFSWALFVSTGGQVRVAPLVPQRLVHDSDVRKVIYCMARVPDTDLIYDLWLTVFSDQDHMPFELRLTASRPSPNWKQEVDWVVMAMQGGFASFRGGISRGVRDLEVLPERATALLLGPGHLWDGQGQDWWGTFLFFRPEVPTADAELRAHSLVAAQISPFYGCGTNWKESGALGPFGHISEHPPWVTDPRQTTGFERAKFESWYLRPGGPWDDLPRGLMPHAGSTGDQHDFGVVKMLHVFHTGLPACIEEARAAASEEAHRPCHFREEDGRLVRAANHPEWVAWSGRTHFNRTVSPDRLGKPHPEPWAESNGWTGRDNQHWSSLTLAAAYLLTRSYSLEMDIEVEIELFLSGHTLPSAKPGWSTNGIDSSRGIGRSLLSLSWHYLLTGREDMRNHMAERIRQCISQQWAGRNVGPVRPVTTAAPDSRIIGNYPFWRPWEDALAIVGLEAAYRVTGQPEARAIARASAKSLFTYGWRAVGNGAEIATGLRWKEDGQPLSAAEYADPEQAVWSQGVGFEMWAMPAAKLARQWAIEDGDEDLRLRAQFVLDSLARNRRTPFNLRWDAFYEWDAIP